MGRGLPSMTALLGLLAIAGFQNRDKIADMLRGSGGSADPRAERDQLGRSGTVSGSTGGLLGGALGELIDRFRESGQGDVADSWVGTGPNRNLDGSQLERALGPEVMATLRDKTGLSREELLARLSRELPTAVDRYTPEGRLPAD